MQKFQRAILTHGSSGFDPQNSDGTQSAAKTGMALMEKGQSALSAVVRAVRSLEDDPRFNAGLGSQLRADGCTIQQDASCMTSNGQFGAVACIEGIQNPVDLAQGVFFFPHIILVGDVPLPGCGLFCGSAGAVACTGDGEFIALKLLAREVYGWLEEKMSPDKAAQKAMILFDSSVDVGLIILTRDEFGSTARNGMAWSSLTEKK